MGSQDNNKASYIEIKPPSSKEEMKETIKRNSESLKEHLAQLGSLPMDIPIDINLNRLHSETLKKGMPFKRSNETEITIEVNPNGNNDSTKSSVNATPLEINNK